MSNTPRVDGVKSSSPPSEVSSTVHASQVRRSGAQQTTAPTQRTGRGITMPSINLPSLSDIGRGIANAFNSLVSKIGEKIDQYKAWKRAEPQPNNAVSNYFTNKLFGSDRRDMNSFVDGENSMFLRNNQFLTIRGDLDTGIGDGSITRIENGTIRNSDGNSLNGHFYKANNFNADDVANQKVVLYLSGSDGPSELYTHQVSRTYTDNNVSVLSVNYRGFGDSEGTPSEAGLYDDARAMFNHLIDQGFQPENIVIHGYSLGGPVATELTKSLLTESPDMQLGGLFLDRPMPSVSKAARADVGLGPIGKLGGALAKANAGSMSIDKKFDSIDMSRLGGVVMTNDRSELAQPQTQLRPRLESREHAPEKFTFINNDHVHLDHNGMIESHLNGILTGLGLG